MDIIEAKRKRSALEELILNEIKKHEEETETYICSINIERLHGGASRQGIIQGVDIELKF